MGFRKSYKNSLYVFQCSLVTQICSFLSQVSTVRQDGSLVSVLGVAVVSPLGLTKFRY